MRPSLSRIAATTRTGRAAGAAFDGIFLLLRICRTAAPARAMVLQSKRGMSQRANAMFHVFHFLEATMYSAAVMEHYRNPRNQGELPDATAKVEVTNPVCGDILTLAVRVENGRIAAARFLTRGCASAVASSSLLTEMLLGKTLPE